MFVEYPYQINSRGQTGTTGLLDHVSQLVDQLLFTAQGERVNLPTFGAGVDQLVFAPNSEELAASTEFLIQSSLTEWLGELIVVEKVSVTAEEANLNISLIYIVISTGERQTEEFTRELNP